MRKFPITVILVMAILTLASAAPAQIAVGNSDADRAEFARHRAALLEHIGDDVAVLFGTYERPDNLRFRQDNRFYYLTGVEVPFAALILDGRSDAAILFLPPAHTGRAVIYDGATIGPGPQAVAEYGIADVRPLAELESVLRELLPEGGTVWTSLSPEETIAGAEDSATAAARAAARHGWAAAETREGHISAWLQEIIPDVNVRNLSTAIDDLRRVKSEWEIARMTEACRIAGEGHLAAWRATRPGVREWELEGAANGAFLAGGALHIGYGAIVGAGPNNNILHYSLSADVADEGELVLMDFGPDYRYYCADITRTWPVSGRFTPEQRRAYIDCLEIQGRLIEAVKPGVTLRELGELNERLARGRGYASNHFHGPSHYIGLSVHDVGDGSKPLEPGVVITVEPGLYFPDRGYGIRIEDVVAVTESGCRVLSHMIPKHPDEIEAIMAAAGPHIAQGLAGPGVK